MDQRVFDQLDYLERGAREQRPLHEYGFQENYGNHDSYDVEDDAIQMDSFDKHLLQQPDYNSRHGQAAHGHARLSLPPQTAMPQPSQEIFATQVSRFAFDGMQPGPSSSSPRHSLQPSSPSHVASRHHQRSFNENAEVAPQYQHRQRPHQQQPSYQPYNYEEANAEDPEPAADDYEIHHPSRRQEPPRPITTENMPVVQGITLVSTRQLPDRVRSVFPFPLFNAVQSKCFDILLNTNDNFVLSSPTGSGKTAVLELAICRLVTRFASDSFKIVYQAPTKSLCSERQRDWQAKFAHLDLKCAELTGDTESTQMRDVQHASIIITTPEKWDSMTRKWKDHQKLMQLVKLFLIDEVHILKEDRGATLEAVVSRMKGLGTDVRFVALSATVPNSQDIATWLGKNHNTPHVPAPLEKFGEEFRPVKLQKHVCGYQNAMNDFAFDSFLNGKLPEVIAKYSKGKPLMVFCFTRKACVETAKLLASWWTSNKPTARYWGAPSRTVIVGEQDLRETVLAGVAFHHAGLTTEDRLAVEKGYLEGDINVICCTSTLAVGVNLPCHMVIIKNTITYQTSGCKEYSDLEIMQMLGRAGRPQFDTSAVAVIMTRLTRVQFYQKMISGQELLESCLHLNLIDHFNAEIGLGTITSASSAKKWLTGTFLYVRLRDNPEHYKLDGDAPERNLDERLETICSKAIALLEQNDLVRGSPKLQCTEFGDAMARYYLQFETMQNLLALPPNAKISEILSAIAQAAEFKDIRFRAGEKPAYKELNKNMSIKFPLPVGIDQPAHKVSLVIQSVLGAIDLPSEDYKARSEYTACKLTVFQHANRLIRCIIDCQLYLEDSVAARNALMLARSLGAQVWDDSPLTMKQLDTVGPVYVRKLVAAGIKSIEGILSTEAHRLETALSRNPPFGTNLQQKAKSFPRLRISLKTMGEPSVKKGEGITIRMKAEIGFLNERVPETFNRRPVYVCVLVDTSDGRKVHFARISGKKLNRGQDVLFHANLTSAGQIVRGFIMCDEIAGTQQTATLKPEIPTFMFPTPKKMEELEKQREATSAAPNTSKRRAIAAAKPRPKAEEDDFGDAGLDDDDLVLAEADGFVNLDDLDTSGDDKKPVKKPTTKKKNAVKSTQSEPKELRESHQLANGRWTCYHTCRIKNTCKHPCCKDGLETKPKAPKPKKPKDIEPNSDPKQTRLDMSKIKKEKPATQSTSAAPRKVDDSKEIRQLNRVASNGKGTTSHVPLLKNDTKPARHVEEEEEEEEAPLEDFGHRSLKSDILIGDDDMLDLTEDVPQDENHQTHAGDVDLSSFADTYEAGHHSNWSYFAEDDTFDDLPHDANALDADADADDEIPFFNLEDNPTRPLVNNRRVFFTDHTSQSILPDTKNNGQNCPEELEDDSGFFPPTKKQKTDPPPTFEQHEPALEDPLMFEQQHEQTMQEHSTAHLQGNEFYEEVLAGAVPQVGRVEEVQAGAQAWFTQHFGEDMFNFVD